MALYDEVAGLPVTIDGCEFSRRERDTSSGFTRVTTVVSLRGDGAIGRGEDVTYDAADHDALSSEAFDLDGDYAFDEFSARLDGIDLFPDDGPGREAFRHYRRWAFESAALDLALRQSETDLASALGRSYEPIRFVVSTRLGEPPSIDRVERWLAVDPDLEFKLDATEEWTADLVDDLAATDSVRIVDLKGQYGSDVGVAGTADPDLYRLVRDGLLGAVIEDPALTEETREVLRGHEERVAWDVPITGVESIEALPFEPRVLNVKPSRFGSLRSLLDSVEYCIERGIDLYGGGQFELDVGRGGIQALASLFYPEAPNDVAPGGYNDPGVTEGLARSPLAPPSDPIGFGW